VRIAECGFIADRASVESIDNNSAIRNPQSALRRCLMGRFILAACVVIALSSPAAAQVSTFDLSGTVLDPSSAVLPGATITLRNTKTGLVRTETADERGRYHFIALPVVGEYSLKVELSGFAADERASLVFQANTRPVIDVTLKLAAMAEATTVQGNAPILETRK